MDCREAQSLLTAFHDGELPADERARAGDHLRGCPECGARLADLARADRAAGVPDPGPGYWDRFNARVIDRIEREADGPKVVVLRPKRGWMGHQLRYLVPAAAAAVLVVVVVRYGGMVPVVPTPAVPPTVAELDSAATKKEESTTVARRVSPQVLAKERFAAMTREERERLAERKKMAGTPAPMSEQEAPTAMDGLVPRQPLKATDSVASADKAKSASGMRVAEEPPPGSPCELARTMAERGRIREAEDAQRACLAGDLDAPSRETGLVFLAELLDRQARFSEADAVITEVDRQFPQSRPLALYRRQRPMVQKQPTAVPVTR